MNDTTVNEGPHRGRDCLNADLHPLADSKGPFRDVHALEYAEASVPRPVRSQAAGAPAKLSPSLVTPSPARRSGQTYGVGFAVPRGWNSAVLGQETPPNKQSVMTTGVLSSFSKSQTSKGLELVSMGPPPSSAK